MEQRKIAYYIAMFGNRSFFCPYGILQRGRHHEIISEENSSLDTINRILDRNSSFFKFLESDLGRDLEREIPPEAIREFLVQTSKYLIGRELRAHFCDIGNYGAENPNPNSRLEILLRPVRHGVIGFHSIEYGLTGTPAKFELLIGPSGRRGDLGEKKEIIYSYLIEKLASYLTHLAFAIKSGQ